MHNVGTTGWLSNRASIQNVTSQVLPAIQTSDAAREILFPAIRWFSVVPSWTILLMVILATGAVCGTVIRRSRVEVQGSAEEFYRMTSEIQSLRQANAALQVETRRLANDSSAIELAARERLGMVRPTDVVVPIESIPSSNLGTLSFVR